MVEVVDFLWLAALLEVYLVHMSIMNTIMKQNKMKEKRNQDFQLEIPKVLNIFLGYVASHIFYMDLA